MSESQAKASINAEVQSLVAMVDVMRLQHIPVTKACQRVGLDRNAYYNYKRGQKPSANKNGGTATTDTAGIDTPGDDRKMPPAFYSKSPETTETTNAIHP